MFLAGCITITIVYEIDNGSRRNVVNGGEEK